MKRDLTELVFILDKSGSMAGLEQDTIGGYNAFLKQQQAVEGKCKVTTVLFNHTYELLHRRNDINTLSPLTEKDYEASGYTALLDAVGKTILDITHAQKQASEQEQATRVMFVIITDGMENSSKEFTTHNVKKLIEGRKAIGWEFIFLGANIDAVTTADSVGISADRVQDFHADGAGVRLNFQVVSEVATSFRQKASLPDNWMEDIERDYRKRK